LDGLKGDEEKESASQNMSTKQKTGKEAQIEKRSGARELARKKVRIRLIPRVP